jgi:hypothetical protein
MENFNTLTVFSSLNSAFSFFVRPYGIIEYEDSNGIPGFQRNDTILSFYSLNQSPANWIQQYISITYGLINATAHVSTWKTNDNVFALQSFLVPQPFIVDGFTINQDTVKVTQSFRVSKSTRLVN